ncbi:MAG: hypothetical protein ACREEV_07555 [Dongiaceae bacterium]
MWTDRQWRDRRIGMREILWSWAIAGAIALGVAAWDGFQALVAEPDLRPGQTVARAPID